MCASRLALIVFVAIYAAGERALADVRMPKIFSDGVVLQRETRVQIFGFAAPGEEVRVSASFGAVSDVALTDQDGRWSTTIATAAAGGPHALEVRGKNVVRVEDVWIGEVWLAAGQSNMEMPVAASEGSWLGVVDWQQVIAQAEDPLVRFFTVENAVAPAVRNEVNGAWAAATPESVARFSASAYFFARRLRAELGVPIGIVAADWGGTPIESWMSGIALARDPDFGDTVARLEREARAPSKAAQTATRAQAGWLHAVEEVDHGLRDGFAQAGFDDADWTKVALPGTLGGDFEQHDGIIWVRRTFVTPGELVGRDVTLTLPPVDDFDAAFVDGVLVGSTAARGSGRSPRVYTIPRVLMTEGKHSLVVRVLDVAGSAGIGGAKDALHLRAGGYEMPLAGEWRARAGAQASVIAARPPDVDFGAHTPTALYNAMIAPLVRYSFRGVIWYQGESNRKGAARYETLFRSLIADWRARFGQAAWPFYFAQIAPYEYQGDVGEAAELREAQRRALALPATGMISTVDLGDARDIHPRRKREVGERLASWALAQTYGRDVEYSGPLVDAARSGPAPSTNEIELVFDHARGLRFTGDPNAMFEIADATTGWVRADARIDGASVILRSAAVAHPTSARFDPRAGSSSYLVNEANLPAAAFQIGPKPWITAPVSRRGRWAASGDLLTLPPPTVSAVDGLPIGNGLLGAFVWIDGSSLKLLLGRSDWWDLRRPEITAASDWNMRDLLACVRARDEARLHERYDEPYERFAYPSRLALAELEIPLPGRRASAFSLDVTRAEAQVTLSSGRIHAYASAARPIVSVRIDDADLERFSPTTWKLTTVGGAVQNVATGVRGEISGPDGSSIGLAVSAIDSGNGIEIAIAFAHHSEDAAPLEAAVQRAQQALDAGYASLFGEHIAAFRSASGAARVSIGDAALQRHYDFARYLFVSASRRGAPPAALQGPWTVDLGLPPWHGDYHNDLNVQATYGAYATAGLFDGGLALFDFHARLMPRFREFAREFYGVAGAVVPGVMSLDGAPLGGWAQYALSPTNSAWTGELFARHWRVTRDADFLGARAAPFCREIATALEALAPVGDDGKRRLALSSSPETHDNSMRAWLTPNSNYDLALLRSSFANAAELERALGREADAAKWKRVLAELPDFELDDNGALAIARGEPYRESHRHLSFALAIQPLAQLSIEGDARERAIVDATLDTILAHGTKQWTGYTFAWFSAMCARAGRPELARRFLLDYERAFTQSNGLHVNGDQSGEGLSNLTYEPFTLEGNMLAMEAVHEMLLQSWGGVVRVFPAVSVTWPEAEFAELRAEGGFAVSARRVDGVTKMVSLRAERAGRLRLRDPFAGRAPRWSNDKVARSGPDFTLDMAQDEVLIGTLEESR